MARIRAKRSGKAAAKSRGPRLGAAVAIGFLALHSSGCAKVFDLLVSIHDPCDGEKAIAASDHIKLDIFDIATDQHATVIWDTGAAEGDLSGVPLVAEALVSVLGLQADGNGAADEEAVVAATTVGVVDLSGGGGEPVYELDLFLGKVGQFHNSSHFADGQRACSNTQAQRWGHTATALPDGRVFLVGGVSPISQTGGQLNFWNSTELFDPITGVFEVGPELKWARRDHTATLLEDGRVVIIGGVYGTGDGVEVSQVAQILDLATDSSTTLAMNVQRTHHTTTLLGNGTLLVVGGREGPCNDGGGGCAGLLASSEIIDPAAKTVRSGPDLLRGRSHHAAVRVSGTQVVLIGGQGQTETIAATEFIDTDKAQGFDCQPAGACDLSLARSHMAAAMVPGADGIVATAGGFASLVDSSDSGVGVDSIDLLQLDLANLENSATVVCAAPGQPVLKSARGATTLAALEDGLLIIGGVGENTGVALGSAEILRVADVTAAGCGASVTAITDSLNSPRAAAAVAPLFGGDFLVTGGFKFSSSELLAVGQAEIYVQHRR